MVYWVMMARNSALPAFAYIEGLQLQPGYRHSGWCACCGIKGQGRTRHQYLVVKKPYDGCWVRLQFNER